MANRKATVLNNGIALMASQLPEAEGDAPEWIHILPAGEMQTADGRGPYTITNAEAVIAASFQEAGDKIVLDENHATDIAGKAGQPARAAGWITQMQSREDGVWAKVDWTEDGRKLVDGKSYRNVSPVIVHNLKGRILRILRVSLTNKPNLRGMVALNHQTENHMENIMELSVLISLLGLEEGATEEDVTAAIKKLTDAKPDEDGGDDAAMQSALTDIAAKLGKDVKAETTAICSAIDAVQVSGDSDTITEMKAMQSQMADTLKRTQKDRAEAVVDKAIGEKRVGVKPLRDHYISRHMASTDGATAVEKELAGLPCLEGGLTDGKIALQNADKDGMGATDHEVAAALGVEPEAYAKTLAANAAKQEAL